MILLFSLTLTALISALHGWGRFRKGYSLPLMALCFCGLLYATGATYWYAGIAIAAAWRVLFRTGSIAKSELTAIRLSDNSNVLFSYGWGAAAMIVATCFASVFTNYFLPLVLVCSAFGAIIHQSLHDNFINYRYLSPDHWYDATGKKFLDARRLSELSGGFFIAGWFNYVLLLLVK